MLFRNTVLGPRSTILSSVSPLIHQAGHLSTFRSNIVRMLLSTNNNKSTLLTHSSSNAVDISHENELRRGLKTSGDPQDYDGRNVTEKMVDKASHTMHNVMDKAQQIGRKVKDTTEDEAQSLVNKLRGSTQHMGDDMKHGMERMDNTIGQVSKKVENVSSKVQGMERMDNSIGQVSKNVQNVSSKIEGIPETMGRGASDSMSTRRHSIDPGASSLRDDTSDGELFGETMKEKVKDTANQMSNQLKNEASFTVGLQRGSQKDEDMNSDRTTQSDSDSSHTIQSTLPGKSPQKIENVDVNPDTAGGMDQKTNLLGATKNAAKTIYEDSKGQMVHMNKTKSTVTESMDDTMKDAVNERAGQMQGIVNQAKESVMQTAHNMKEKVKTVVMGGGESYKGGENVQPGTPPLRGTEDNFDNDPGVSIDQMQDRVRQATDAVKETAQGVKEKVREVITGERSWEKPDETKSEVRTRKADYKAPKPDEQKKRGSSSE